MYPVSGFSSRTEKQEFFVCNKDFAEQSKSWPRIYADAASRKKSLLGLNLFESAKIRGIRSRFGF
jgi:hypothetical protein